VLLGSTRLQRDSAMPDVEASSPALPWAEGNLQGCSVCRRGRHTRVAWAQRFVSTLADTCCASGCACARRLARLRASHGLWRLCTGGIPNPKRARDSATQRPFRVMHSPQSTQQVSSEAAAHLLLAQVAESHTKWGAALSAPLISMLAAVGLSASGLLPLDCAAYGKEARAGQSSAPVRIAMLIALLHTRMQALSGPT
jgi:hypothetical protein